VAGVCLAGGGHSRRNAAELSPLAGAWSAFGAAGTQGQGIFLTLDEPLLHGFIKLLQQAVQRAEWGFKLELPWTEPPAPATGDRTLQ